MTARSGDVSSTRQHSVVAHATEEETTSYLWPPPIAYITSVFLCRVAIRYALPFLWMGPCLDIIARNRRREKERLLKVTHHWVAPDQMKSLISTSVLYVAERTPGAGQQRDTGADHRGDCIQRLPGASAPQPDLLERPR